MAGTNEPRTPASLRAQATKAVTLAASTTDDHARRALRQFAAELEAKAKTLEAKKTDCNPQER